MFGFWWVGGSWQNGCSDLKIRWFKKFKTNRFFLLWMFGSLCGWVTINPNTVRIFKSIEIHGLSLRVNIHYIASTPFTHRCLKRLQISMKHCYTQMMSIWMAQLDSTHKLTMFIHETRRLEQTVYTSNRFLTKGATLSVQQCQHSSEPLSRMGECIIVYCLT